MKPMTVITEIRLVAFLYVSKNVHSKLFICCRKWPSYFHDVPEGANQHRTDFEQVCRCSEDGGTTKECTNGIKTLFGYEKFPNYPEKLSRILMCDRKTKRDIEGSDDLTKEDFELFNKPMENKPLKRSKRSLSPISKDNATQYCNERIAETPVGKLCAKLGTNIQALVNICSADIQVNITCNSNICSSKRYF